jgi:hypothetical protein
MDCLGNGRQQSPHEAVLGRTNTAQLLLHDLPRPQRSNHYKTLISFLVSTLRPKPLMIDLTSNSFFTTIE